MARPARRIELGIDPPDIAVGTPIDEVEFAMRAIAEEQYQRISEIHPHYRLADGEVRQLGAHLSDHRRRTAGPLFGHILLLRIISLRSLGHRRQHISHRTFGRRGCLARLCMLITQASLVAAQLLGEAFGSRVEGRMSLGGRSVRVDDDATADVDRHLGCGQMGLLRNHNMGFDRGLEILLEYGTQARFDMESQGIADIDLLARRCQLHGFRSPLPAGVWLPWRLPRANVGTRARTVKRFTVGNSRFGPQRWRVVRPATDRFTGRAAYPGGAAPKRECASHRDTLRPCGGRYRHRPAAAIRRCARPTACFPLVRRRSGHGCDGAPLPPSAPRLRATPGSTT